jgi:hypothetical protein
MERYQIYLLRCGMFDYWTGRCWDIRPYNAKCYGTSKAAEEAMPAALKKTRELVSIVEGTLDVPK